RRALRRGGLLRDRLLLRRRSLLRRSLPGSCLLGGGLRGGLLRGGRPCGLLGGLGGLLHGFLDSHLLQSSDPPFPEDVVPLDGNARCYTLPGLQRQPHRSFSGPPRIPRERPPPHRPPARLQALAEPAARPALPVRADV